MTLGLALSLAALVTACGGGGGRDPILGADVTQAVLVPPAGAVTPPGVIEAVPVVTPADPVTSPETVIAPVVVVPPVVVAPVTPGLLCPASGPVLTMTDPADGELQASTATAAVASGGKRITASFGGNVDGGAFTANSFRVAQAGQPAMSPASVSYDTTSKVAAYVTQAALLPDTSYLAVIEVPASSVPGADAGCVYAWSWSFKTAAVVANPGPVNFGVAESYAIAATAGVSNTAATFIGGDAVLNPTDTCNAVAVGGNGDFGLCGGAPPNITGTVVTPTYPNATLAQQVTDALRAAYLSITPPSGPPAAGSLGGGTTLATTSIGAPAGSVMVSGQNYFAPGVYTSGSSIDIAGDITLDGQGDANAVFVFQAGSSITALPGAPSPAPHTRILLVNGAKASNVFWQAGSSATLGSHAEWYGNVLAGANITMQTAASSCGRLFAGAFTTGAFVFDANTVSIPGKPASPPGCL